MIIAIITSKYSALFVFTVFEFTSPTNGYGTERSPRNSFYHEKHYKHAYIELMYQA